MTIQYMIADNGENDVLSFESAASSIEEAVSNLVESFDAQFNPAKIDVLSVLQNGKDLGIDGVYEAEIALAQHYD